jgi:hypothetical protein
MAMRILMLADTKRLWSFYDPATRPVYFRGRSSEFGLRARKQRKPGWRISFS